MLGTSEIDEYDLVDPVDILTPLGKSTFWDGVVSIPLRGRVFASGVYDSVLCLRCLSVLQIQSASLRERILNVAES